MNELNVHGYHQHVMDALKKHHAELVTKVGRSAHSEATLNKYLFEGGKVKGMEELISRIEEEYQKFTKR
jgi:hypothetical protein